MSKAKNESKPSNKTADSNRGTGRTQDSNKSKSHKGRTFDHAPTILPDEPFPPLEPEKPKPSKARKIAGS